MKKSNKTITSLIFALVLIGSMGVTATTKLNESANAKDKEEITDTLKRENNIIEVNATDVKEPSTQKESTDSTSNKDEIKSKEETKNELVEITVIPNDTAKKETERPFNPTKSSSPKTEAPAKDPVKKPESKPAVEKDTTKPIISGVNNITVEFGASFNIKSGVSASDNKDGNITGKISISGNVNTSVSGTYTLTYTVSDSARNKTTATRTVTVKEQVKEVVHETGLETQLFNLINEYRNSNGVESITFSNNQYAKADKLAHAKAEADMKDSSHYANEISIVYGGPKLSASQFLQMWKNSPSHNDFLLSPRKHFGGCAAYRNGNTYYIIFEGRIDDR